jgi:hypothetical protein
MDYCSFCGASSNETKVWDCGYGVMICQKCNDKIEQITAKYIMYDLDGNRTTIAEYLKNSKGEQNA